MSQLWTAYLRNDSNETCESDKTPLRFYAELFAEHSPTAVWSFFTDLTKWTRWSPICRGCRLTDQGDLRLGSTLQIRFKVMGLTFTASATVVQFDPPTSITWQVEQLGIRAAHRYRFIPRDEGTLLCNEETFAGVRFPLNRLIGIWYRASNLSSASLIGISRELASGG